MPFSKMIKLKHKFLKSIQNKITKNYQFQFFLKIKKDYTTQKYFNSEKKEKEKVKEATRKRTV